MNVDINYVKYYNMFYNAFFKENKSKNIILEPISCVVKLILLNYKSDGTKIAIGNKLKRCKAKNLTSKVKHRRALLS